MAVITISRLFGSGGKTLGEMVSEKLGYTFFDDQIIQMIASEANVSPSWVSCIEREAGRTLVKFKTLVGRKSFVERIMDKRGYIDEEIYVELLHKIITVIAQADNVIILGRGSQYILKDLPNAYHFLLVADKPHRIIFMKERYNFSQRRAVQIINRQDKRRLNLYQRFGKYDYNQPRLYHMVLNMSKMSMEKACDLICLKIGVSTGERIKVNQ